jgi:putative transcriptional regulator
MKNKIKIQRAIHNLTQAELAEKIGVSRQTINAMELGKYTPSTILALKIAKLFGKNVEDIFQLEDEE